MSWAINDVIKHQQTWEHYERLDACVVAQRSCGKFLRSLSKHLFGQTDNTLYLTCCTIMSFKSCVSLTNQYPGHVLSNNTTKTTTNFITTTLLKYIPTCEGCKANRFMSIIRGLQIGDNWNIQENATH